MSEMKNTKAWNEPGTKEFLIREILCCLPVSTADATAGVREEIANLISKGSKLYDHFIPDLTLEAGKQKEVMTFALEWLADIIKRDVLSTLPSGTAH